MGDVTVLEEAVFHRDSLAPSLARSMVRTYFEGWDEVTADHLADLLLGVSELVTNVIEHTESEPVVTIAIDDGRIKIAVGDRSPADVEVRASTPDAPNGRGLQLVAHVAAAWGAFRAGNGTKWVWFTVDLRSAEQQ